LIEPVAPMWIIALDAGVHHGMLRPCHEPDGVGRNDFEKGEVNKTTVSPALTANGKRLWSRRCCRAHRL